MAGKIAYNIMTGEPYVVEDPTTVKYGGVFPRLGAFLLDSLIASVAAGILTGLFRLIPFMNTEILFSHSAADILFYLAYTAYFVVLTKTLGTTLGKKAFRLKVVSCEGELGWLSVIYRETIGRFLSAIMLVGYIFIIFNKRKQGLHDILADTLVVYDD